MKSIGWFRNANYYKVKNWLINHGFEVTDYRGFNNNQKKTCYCKYSNGIEYIILFYTVKKGISQELICDTVYDYINGTYSL